MCRPFRPKIIVLKREARGDYQSEKSACGWMDEKKIDSLLYECILKVLNILKISSVII